MSAMLYGKRIAVVLPAYNAARTLEKTVAEIPADVVDTILLVDDSSKDETIEIAHRLGLQVFPHEQNYGYGRNRHASSRLPVSTPTGFADGGANRFR